MISRFETTANGILSRILPYILNFADIRQLTVNTMRFRLSSSLILALVFLLFGIIWIFFSDALLMSFTRGDLELNSRMQSLKGVIFVLASAIFIYLVSNKL